MFYSGINMIAYATKLLMGELLGIKEFAFKKTLEFDMKRQL